MLRWLKSLRRRSDGDEGFSRVVVLLMVLGVLLLAVASAYVFKFQQPQPETVARQPVEELVSQDKLHSGLPLVKSPTAASPMS
jgi:flagellar basal body-associated protein FliL